MPIPDEKARAWTRPEDYWPPRRLRRTSRYASRPLGQITLPEPAEEPRPLLDIVPYAVLMIGLALLALAIIVLAWPGREAAQPKAPEPVVTEVGTAPKGWIDDK